VLTPGTEVGGYRVEGLLGRGGMGIVYEATQHSLGRRVALKLLAAELSLDQSFRRRFQREGRLQAGLDHAHIVPIYEAGELEDHGLFIAMRLVRGATLKQLVRAGELDGERLVTILRPVADALDTAHEAGLVHRDIKPQNILVGRRDHAYLADFGLTRAPGDTAFTKTGQFVGTLDYIAPEQIRGEQPTPASDLYSFAAVAYECLTGSVPFPRPNEASVLFAHMSDPPPRPSERAPGLPSAVDDVIATGMGKTAAERQVSVVAFVQDLQSVLGADLAALRLGPPQPPAETFDPASMTDAEAGAGAPTVAAQSPAEPTSAASTRSAARPAVESTVAAAAPTTVARSGTAPHEAPAPEDPGEATEVRSRIGASTQADRRRPWPAGAPAAEPGVAPPSAAAAPPPAPSSPVTARPGAVLAAPPRERGRRRAGPSAAARRTVAGVLALAAAGVVGLVAGGTGEKAAAPAKAGTPAERRVVAAGPVKVHGPPGWRAGEVPPVPGLALRQAAALAGAGGAMAAGLTDATGATLLPFQLRRNLEGGGVRADRVRLGDAAAYRYRDLTLRGADDPVTALVVPTDAGVATVACTGAEAARRACEAAATSLVLDAKGYALGPSAAYAKRLRATLDRLSGRRAQALATWRRARTRKGQGKAATSAAGAYNAAAKAVGALTATPLERTAQAALRRSLVTAGAAYDRVAVAARTGKAKAYGKGRNDVRAAEQAVGAALGGYAGLGYRVR
jgi:serine/threonine protein kinase